MKKLQLKKKRRSEKKRVQIMSKTLVPYSIKNYIDHAIAEEAPNFKLKFKIEWLYYFVNTIIRRQNSYSNKKLQNAPIALNAEIMKSWVSNYNEYIEWLIEKDIIMQAENYAAGKSSKKFCFSEYGISLLGRDSEIAVIDNENLASDKIIIERSIQQSPVYKENEHLLKWFNDKLEIDFEKAKVYIQDLVFYEGEIFDLDFKKVHWQHQISALHHKMFYATRNEESDFRLHTVLTSLKKIFKPFTTYDGQEIIGYDLKNSQPFFLIFLIESLINNNNKINNIIDRAYSKNVLYTFMLQKVRESLSSKGFRDEYVIFKKWVLDGRIYENMIQIIKPEKHFGSYFTYVYNEKLKCKVKQTQDSIRGMMKGVFFTLLFCGVKTKDKYYHMFKREFPNLVGLIELFKIENHADFSKLLQNIESECIIDFVTKKIAEQYPEMPLFTIHDSISTTTEFAEVLGALMPQYVQEFTGLMPKIEKEKWKEHEYQTDYEKYVDLHPEWYCRAPS
ncbi:hypothetical protein CMU57_06255 [Elizabethkingia anophelis]|nr:hypothetical protein [Elizabethkingia anophelis]MDV3723795.1 hypothetical protein [Elizabethkingia anophelis]